MNSSDEWRRWRAVPLQWWWRRRIRVSISLMKLNQVTIRCRLVLHCTNTHHSNIPTSYKNTNTIREGPSLESSSYLNVTLRYLGPWDPWTLGLLDCLLTPFHILLFLPTSFYLLLPPCLLWFGMGGGVRWLWSFLSFDIGDWDWRQTLDLYMDV